MNRETYPDVPHEHATQSILGLKVKYENRKAGGQHRQHHSRQKESKMSAFMHEKNKGGLARTARPDVGTSDASLQSTHRLQLIHICVFSPATRVFTSALSARGAITDGDLRRNLYVLGLPFDLTKVDFIKIFQAFGTVTHAVILATLDSASRRRGFIVMGSHQEAKRAMDSLSRTQKGHMLDVSWAVVQRSQGFLDGPDRTMMLAISAPSSVPGDDDIHPVSDGLDVKTNTQWNLSHIPTSKLLVSNLPSLLFTQVSDLHPLFFPFGPIKDIKILGSLPTVTLDGTLTAMVEYGNASSAQEAKESLQLQSYAGYPVEVHYIYDVATSIHPRPAPFFSGPLLGHGNSCDISLNPFATPFSIGSRFTAQMYDPGHNPRHGAAIPSGLPGDAPLAPQPFPLHLKPYVTDAISRSSSATSSNWSQDGRPFRPPRISYSSFTRASTPSTSTPYAQDN